MPASEVGAAILVLIVPVVGYVAHQFFRVLFEITDGFERDSRQVLSALTEIRKPKLTKREAFLVWELTFYHPEFPETFREHDRRAWHFILSFWSVTCAVVLSLVSYAARQITHPVAQTSWLFVIGALFLGVVFWLKGRLTYRSLCAQESAVYELHRDLFEGVARKLFGGGAV